MKALCSPSLRSTSRRNKTLRFERGIQLTDQPDRTDAQLETYLKTYWLPEATTSDLATFATVYPNDITQGAEQLTYLSAANQSNARIAIRHGYPGRTLAAIQAACRVSGMLDVASITQRCDSLALQGDAVFQAPRRFFQQELSGKQNMWGFCESPALGI